MRRPLLLEIGIVLESLGLGVLAFYLSGFLGGATVLGIAVVLGFSGLGIIVAAGVAFAVRPRRAR